MFILDSLLISGIQWALKTTLTAAEAEMNDDTALREQLLEAEMRREMGEITNEEFKDLEADLLARIREIKERREGAGPLAFGGAQPMETSPDSTFQIETELSGDFHQSADTPEKTVIAVTPTSVEEVVVSPSAPTPLRRAHSRSARATTRSRHGSPKPSSGERRRARTTKGS
jgi:hypothetical protein